LNNYIDSYIIIHRKIIKGSRQGENKMLKNNFKKIIAISLVIGSMLSFVACGNKDNNAKNTEQSS
jgi:hypothetical protein